MLMAYTKLGVGFMLGQPIITKVMLNISDEQKRILFHNILQVEARLQDIKNGLAIIAEHNKINIEWNDEKDIYEIKNRLSKNVRRK
jgi:hypothetical protein